MEDASNKEGRGEVQSEPRGPERFRKLPAVIEAMQYTGPNWRDVLEFIGETSGHWREATRYWPEAIVIYTLEGPHDARPGDWIIKGVKGEFYPCKPGIFAATYERVTDGGEASR